jgi:Protein of unknown function (DUF4446)
VLVEGTDRMTLSTSTLTLLVLIALGLSVLAIVFLISSGARREVPSAPLAGDEAVGVLLSRIQRLEKAARTLHATDKRQQFQIEAAVRRVALLRYDAFEDVGGRLSFSCALLDEQGTGIVLTSINGRQDTRVYAKPVTSGASPYNLSLEEEEAIRQALAGSAETVKER